MNLVQAAMRRPLTVIVLIVAVMMGAILAVREMPRDIFPTLGIPTIYVAQPYAGVDPAQVESYLTYYYEYHFLYITVTADFEHARKIRQNSGASGFGIGGRITVLE
jgi:Cu/Ag efflux pump CusA